MYKDLHSFKFNPNDTYHIRDFYNIHDAEFVQVAYLAILKRSPDTLGERYYLNRIRSGISKENILIQIIKSPEAKQHGICIHGLKIYAALDYVFNIPLLGTIVALLIFLLTIKAHMRSLRALENYVYQIPISISSEQKHKSSTDK